MKFKEFDDKTFSLSSRYAQTAILAALVMLTSGCSTSRVLYNDFEAYPGTPSLVSFPPDIPGDPSGDSIHVIGSPAAVETGFLSGKSGEIRHDAIVEFRTTSHQTPDEYRIQWASLTTDVSASQADDTLAVITLLDGSNREAIRVQVRPQDIMLHTGDEVRLPVFGFNAGSEHSFRVTLLMGLRRIHVEFRQDGELMDQTNLKFIDGQFNGLAAIRVEPSHLATYHIDDIDVITIDN